MYTCIIFLGCCSLVLAAMEPVSSDQREPMVAWSTLHDTLQIIEYQGAQEQTCIEIYPSNVSPSKLQVLVYNMGNRLPGQHQLRKSQLIETKGWLSHLVAIGQTEEDYSGAGYDEFAGLDELDLMVRGKKDCFEGSAREILCEIGIITRKYTLLPLHKYALWYVINQAREELDKSSMEDDYHEDC